MLVLAAFVLVVTLGCSSAGLAVWGGAASPPWFDQHVGPLRVIGYRTWNASCPPYRGCDPTLHEAYVVWLAWDSTTPIGVRVRAYQLMRLPISHGP